MPITNTGFKLSRPVSQEIRSVDKIFDGLALVQNCPLISIIESAIKVNSTLAYKSTSSNKLSIRRHFANVGFAANNQLTISDKHSLNVAILN